MGDQLRGSDFFQKALGQFQDPGLGPAPAQCRINGAYLAADELHPAPVKGSSRMGPDFLGPVPGADDHPAVESSDGHSLIQGLGAAGQLIGQVRPPVIP